MSLLSILHNAPRLPPGEKRVLPMMGAIATGAAIFALLSLVPVALGFLSYGLGMGALAALTMAGLVLSYRAGVLSIFGATFAALLPASLAVGGADDLKSARRAVVAEIAVADAPRHPDAQILLLSDARVATEFATRWVVRPSVHGAEQHLAVAPLVPHDWQRATPIPAWRVCSGGTPAWCAQALAHPARATRRLTTAEAIRYRDGINDALRRFGLESAPAAPLLQLATPPAERASAAVTAMVALPVLGFAVWLLGLLAWRSVSRLRRSIAG